MRKLLKAFLEENMIYESVYEEYNYEFCNGNDREAFSIEFKKFIGMYNTFFYDKDRFVTVINSNEIVLDKKVIEHLFNMYKYAKENEMYDEKVLLIEFLYTYYKGINSSSYKANYANFKKSMDDFLNVINEKKLKKEFFTVVIVDLYAFYKSLINYGINNEIYIDHEIINRIFNNLKIKPQYYNELINIFICNKKNLYNIIEFDNEKKEHINTYIEYMTTSLDNFGGYNYVKEMFFQLDKGRVLTSEICKNIINKYINITNQICNRLKDKQYSFIKGLSEIDTLKKELNYILKNISSLNYVQRNKVRECLVQLLRLKRYIIADHDYVKSEMHEFSNEIKIDNSEVEKCRKIIIENEFTIYASSKIDFVNQIGIALESYAKYPIQSLVSNYQIDSNKQIYSLNIEKNEKKDRDNFKKYFDEKGKEYTEKHPKLMNKLYGNYYEELLRYLSKTFIMQQELILSMLGKVEFKNTITKLKMSLGYEYNNEYAIVVNNILAIEQNISYILKEKGLEISLQGFENINNLFEVFKEDNSVINGLMYLNYTLYEKSGMNLRNNMMHGNLINTDLSIPLLVSFSGLIFVSWLRNDKR